MQSQGLSPSTQNCPSWMLGKADFPDNKNHTVSAQRSCICGRCREWPTDTTPSPRVVGSFRTHLITMEVSHSIFMHSFETNKSLVYIYPADPNIPSEGRVYTKKEPISSPTNNGQHGCINFLFKSIVHNGRLKLMWYTMSFVIILCRDRTLRVPIPANQPELLIHEIKPPSDGCTFK